jgi:hypothetical protein
MGIFKSKLTEREVILDAFSRMKTVYINPHIYCNKEGDGVAPNDGLIYGQHTIMKSGEIGELVGRLYFGEDGKLAAFKVD